MNSPEPQYQALVAHVQELEQKLEEAERQLRTKEHQLSLEQAMAARRTIQLKTVQTLNLAVFSGLKEEEIYQLACQSIVHQIGWDVAFVITMKGGRGTVLASYHATEKQLAHLNDYLNQNPVIVEAYAHHAALVTHQGHDKQSLVLRSLFHVEELAALPIMFGEQCFGYLVAGETTTEHTHPRDEVDFLAAVASLLAYAVQQNASLMSLEEQNTKLRQLDELKDSFISITSHQLRTPLSIIKWILSILQSDKMLEPFEEQSKMIGQAYETNERLIHVVNDLLNVSRIQEGKLPYNPQPADLGQFIKETCENARSLFENKNIKLEIDIEDHLPTLQLDPILFKEALQNLLDNGVDYNLSEHGWVKVSAHIENGYIVVRVSNAGAPIPLEEWEKIFEQFYRSPEAVTIHPNGNGLGLYLARAIVAEHQGLLKLEESTQEKTSFTITLPLPQQP